MIGVRELYGEQIPEWRRVGSNYQEIADLTGLKSREAVRIILKKFYPDVTPYPSQKQVARLLGVSTGRLDRLRKKGISHPTRHGVLWRYGPEDIEIARKTLIKSCAICGSPTNRPKYCEKCGMSVRKYRYPLFTPEQKAAHKKRVYDWQKNNPEKWAIINKRAGTRYREKMRQEVEIG